jgi:hypothetical protein
LWTRINTQTKILRLTRLRFIQYHRLWQHSRRSSRPCKQHGSAVDAPSGGPGSANTAVGLSAFSSNTIDGVNTAIGANALVNNTLGNGNIPLGLVAGQAVIAASNVIAIGAAGADLTNSCYIGEIYTNVQAQVGTDPDLITINSSGRLGRGNESSRRYKHDIKPVENASEAIYALKPVSFRYHKQYDVTQTIAFGLIAEQVADVNPDLVGRNATGQPESVRYEQINAMLLNDFLKEHGKVEQQRKGIEAALAHQQKQIEALTAGLQKVSAQLELRKPAPQIVLNSP